MKISAKQVSNMTVDELKSIIHEMITEDMEAWRETFEIMADKKMMRQLRQADSDWTSGVKDYYVSWDARGAPLTSKCIQQQTAVLPWANIHQ